MPYIYCVVRKDLSPAQQAVQACHVCIEAAPLIPAGIDHPHLVLLGVEDERRLRSVINRLEASGVKYRTFHEADIGHQLTAVATEPVYSEEHRRLFKRYQLLNYIPQREVA